MTLSELVAVEVLKAPIIDSNTPVPEGIYVYEGAAYYGKNTGQSLATLFLPNEDMAATARVLQHMRATGWGYSIAEPWNNTCRVMFTRRPSHAEVGVSEIPIGEAEAPLGELKEAICIAALRAVGVSDDRIEKARRST